MPQANHNFPSNISEPISEYKFRPTAHGHFSDAALLQGPTGVRGQARRFTHFCKCSMRCVCVCALLWAEAWRREKTAARIASGQRSWSMGGHACRARHLLRSSHACPICPNTSLLAPVHARAADTLPSSGHACPCRRADGDVRALAHPQCLCDATGRACLGRSRLPHAPDVLITRAQMSGWIAEQSTPFLAICAMRWRSFPLALSVLAVDST